MTSLTIKSSIPGSAIGRVSTKNGSILDGFQKVLRILGTAWEESRVEYKKRAILGGGWE